jgi:hypothetical protein
VAVFAPPTTETKTNCHTVGSPPCGAFSGPSLGGRGMPTTDAQYQPDRDAPYSDTATRARIVRGVPGVIHTFE